MAQENKDIFSNAITELQKKIAGKDIIRVNEYIDPMDLARRAVIEQANSSNPLEALVKFQNKYNELSAELTDKASYMFTETADNIFAKNLLVNITAIYEEELKRMIRNLLSESTEKSHELSLQDQLNNLDKKYEELRKNPLASKLLDEMSSATLLDDITPVYKAMRIEMIGKIAEQGNQQSSPVKKAQEKLRDLDAELKLKSEATPVDNTPDRGSQIFREIIKKSGLQNTELEQSAIIESFYKGQKYLTAEERLDILEKKYVEIRDKVKIYPNSEGLLNDLKNAFAGEKEKLQKAIPLEKQAAELAKRQEAEAKRMAEENERKEKERKFKELEEKENLRQEALQSERIKTFDKTKSEYKTAEQEFLKNNDKLTNFSKELGELIAVASTVEKDAKKESAEKKPGTDVVEKSLLEQLIDKKAEVDALIKKNNADKPSLPMRGVHETAIQEAKSSLEKLKTLNEGNKNSVSGVESFFNTQKEKLGGVIDKEIQKIAKDRNVQLGKKTDAENKIKKCDKEQQQIDHAVRTQALIKPQKIADVRGVLETIRNTVYTEAEKKVTGFPALLKAFRPNELLKRQEALPEIIQMNARIQNIESNIIKIENFSSQMNAKELLKSIGEDIDAIKKLLKTITMTPNDREAIEDKLDSFDAVAMNTVAYHNAKFINTENKNEANREISSAQMNINNLNTEEKKWSDIKAKIGSQQTYEPPTLGNK